MIEPVNSRRAVAETIIGVLIWSVIWAGLLNCVLELMHSGGNVGRLIGYSLYLHFALFAMNAAVIWVIFLLVLAVLGRLWITCAVTLAGALVIGLVNRTKLDLRSEPVYPSDLDFLKKPGFLIAMVSPQSLVLGVLCIGLVVGSVILFGRIPARTFRPIRRSSNGQVWAAVLVARVMVVALCLASLGYVAHFNESGNRFRAAYEASGAEWAWWYQTLNYENNGFVAGLMYNLPAKPMAVPEGYSASAMRQISERYSTLSETMNRGRQGSIDDVNVIAVLSEALSDPAQLKGVDLERDPLPFTHQVMRGHTSGTMLAQLFGGGTANMEFETLTGQSLSQLEPQINTPFQQFVHRMPDYPSVVGFLRSRGHRAVAIHPYMTAMYHRNEVYRNLGIEEFIYDKTMRSTDRIDDNEFVSDRSTFHEVAAEIEESDKPLFANIVTMQNHFPMAGVYDDPWPVAGVTGDTRKHLAGYARGLNHSDRALHDLLTKLSRSKEKTAVVLYGDHLPAFWDEKTQDENGERAMRSTPYFVWTNFETPKLETAPLTSPVYFLPLLFEQLDAPVPPYYALLTELYREVPAMAQGKKFGSDGAELEESDLSPRAKQLLRDYRMVQYDLSVGSRFAADRMFYSLPAGSEESVSATGK